MAAALAKNIGGEVSQLLICYSDLSFCTSLDVFRALVEVPSLFVDFLESVLILKYCKL